MKTSNKLLLGFLLFTLVVVASIAIAARMNTRFDFFEGNGNKVSETLLVPDFDKVSVNGQFKVYIRQGAEQEVKLDADENLLAEIETNVVDGELKLSLLHKIGKNDTIAIFLTLDTLKQLEFSGGSVVNTLTQIKGNEIKIKSLSGSEGDLNLNYRTLTFEARSGAVAHLRGAVDQADFDFHSGAVVEAYHLKIANCTAAGSSGGVAKVHVSNQLNVQVASGAVLAYDGAAQVNIVKTSSGGAVERR